MGKSSAIKGYYKKSIKERLKILKEYASLDDNELAMFEKEGALELEAADKMVENVVGTFQLPLGIATNFQVNGKDYLVPMAIEEPSVVAAASNGAKVARAGGGFTATTTDPIMISQIQVTGLEAPFEAKLKIFERKEELLEEANAVDPMLIKVGGGARDIEIRIIDAPSGPMLIVHLLVDTRDAMGANAVNSMAERLAPMIEDITGGNVFLRILSNLAVYRLARARAVFPARAMDKGDWKGVDVAKGIVKAWEFAYSDPFRAATHNKGIMNGIDPVIIATGNDFRAIEAGAHAYAAMDGYGPLTGYEINGDDDLVGSIEVPMAVGIIGGAAAVHPMAKVNRKIMGIKGAAELGRITAAVGLAQNFSALRALATFGIQKGHMKLHARNIAATVGAKGDEVEKVARLLVKEKKIRMDRAKEVLERIREKD